MFKTFRVQLNERAVVLQDGLPLSALPPGKHVVWGFGLTAMYFDTNALLCDAPAEVRAIMPEPWITEIHLDVRQRGILSRDAKPFKFLRPGTHRFWTVDPSVRVDVFSVDEAVPELSDELAALIPPGELVDQTVLEHQRGLLYIQGKFANVLEPGRHAFWSHGAARISVRVIDMRRQQVTLTGQELMTRDKVTLRLTLTVEYAPMDPSIAAHAIANAEQAVYLLAQLAAREYVASVTLDELLEGREAMTRYLEELTVPQAEQFGIRIERIGVKDVVLPGDMKLLLNRVIEAEKQAAANVILRREESAATRSMANAARVMAEEPTLMRLKELETLEKIASRIQELRLVVGVEEVQRLLSRHTSAPPDPPKG
jgi:regulator of protease activity HflC (stomatin/prohibitin superfamily)